MTKQRTPSAKLDDIVGELPEATLPDDLDLESVAQQAVVKLNGLQEEHLAPYAIWRDLLALTGHYRTFYSASTVLRTLTKLSNQKKRSVFRVKEGRKPRTASSGKTSSWVDIDILFTAQNGNLAENCMGTVSVIQESNGKWRIWMLRTWLECFDGRGHPDVISAVDGAPNEVPYTLSHETNGAVNGATNGIANGHVEEYGAIVVGGGQAGLAVAGRLKALGVSYVLIEKHAKIGDTWAVRYESLRWHTSKDYGVLPFGHTFPVEDDYMLPAKRIGSGHKAWAKKYGINYRTSTTVDSARWDYSAGIWSVTTSGPDGQISVKAKNLVLATGTGHSTPVYPSWASEENIKASRFKGKIQHAFTGYHSAHEWQGKRGVVIGTANTAHDIAEDMANAGMETTMVQRGATFVFPAEWLHAAEDIHYHRDMHPAEADRETITYPNKIMREMINRAVWAGIKANPDRFDALEKAGFKLDRWGDTYYHLFVRFGGHYVDIGASDRIAKGEIKVTPLEVKSLNEDGLVFEDGTTLGADLIVLCTGFNHDFREDAARIIGRETADQVDDYYGVDHEGELRAHAKKAGRMCLLLDVRTIVADFSQIQIFIIMAAMYD